MMSVTSSLAFRCGGAKGPSLEGSIVQSTHPREAGDAMADGEAGARQAETEPRPAAVAFVTTELFTLQGARSLATIAEATSRATMFLGAVSGGLVALGLIATAAGVRTAFYAFALILLPTLVLVGLTTWTGCCGRDRGLRLRNPDRAAARLLLSVRARTRRLPAQRPPGGAAAPAGDRGRALAEVPDGLGDGRARHRRAGSAAGLLAMPLSLTTRSSQRSSPASWSPSRCSPR